LAISKRHHYVPQFYLRYFVDADGLLHVYDKDNQACRSQTPGNTTVENRFYGYSDSAGNYNDDIERGLAGLESKAKHVFDRWQQSGARPESDEILLMSQFLALMHCRVPRTINAAKELMVISGFEVAKIAAERRDLLEEFFASQQAKGRPAIDTDKFLESLKNAESRFTIEANPKIALAESLSTARTVAELLASMNWCLCRAPGGWEFITSDGPLCVLAKTADAKILLGAGFGLPSAEVHFPISPSYCLRLENRQMQRRAAVSSNFVDELNRRTAANAERYVISSRGAAKIKALTAEFAFTRNRPKLDRKVVADIMGRRLRANLERNRPSQKKEGD